MVFKSLYAFPQFALIHRVLKKVEEERVPSLMIVTLNNFRKGPQNQQHPLIQNGLSQEAFDRGTAEDLGGRSGGLVPP